MFKYAIALILIIAAAADIYLFPQFAVRVSDYLYRTLPQADVRSLLTAIEMYKSDHHSYPDSTSDLIKDDYLSEFDLKFITSRSAARYIPPSTSEKRPLVIGHTKFWDIIGYSSTDIQFSPRKTEQGAAANP